MVISVVILSFNVKKLLEASIRSIFATYKKKNIEIIVVDNHSSDGSLDMVKSHFPGVKIINSSSNIGFAAGNNLARKICTGDIVLFLNPDTLIKGDAIEKCLNILKTEPELGAITCKVVLPNGTMDYSCHRGLPTPWNTFCYLTGLAKLFSHKKLFSGYTASYLDITTSHDVDCITGAFLMIKRKVLDKINWWDEDYWWNGEDIEFCYQIKKAGYHIRYEPSEEIIHYKGSSSGLYNLGIKNDVSSETKIRSAKSATKAMRIFINKHWKELGPAPLMLIVRFGIYLLEKLRLWKIELSL